MSTIKFKGIDVNTSGSLPKPGNPAHNFDLVSSTLSKVTLDEFKGKRVILNIFPSLDTGTCAASVRRFNKIATELENTVVLCISRDLPFAQKRFCGAEGISNVVTLSDFESGDFGKKYGIYMIDGPLKGLLARCVVVIDEAGIIKYTQLVQEITEEPDYEDTLANL